MRQLQRDSIWNATPIYGPSSTCLSCIWSRWPCRSARSPCVAVSTRQIPCVSRFCIATSSADSATFRIAMRHLDGALRRKKKRISTAAVFRVERDGETGAGSVELVPAIVTDNLETARRQNDGQCRDEIHQILALEEFMQLALVADNDGHRVAAVFAQHVRVALRIRRLGGKYLVVDDVGSISKDCVLTSQATARPTARMTIHGAVNQNLDDEKFRMCPLGDIGGLMVFAGSLRRE